MVNYQTLLTKYINHVGMMEGVDFIPRDVGGERWQKSAYDFTTEELEALWEIVDWDEYGR